MIFEKYAPNIFDTYSLGKKLIKTSIDWVTPSVFFDLAYLLSFSTVCAWNDVVFFLDK